MKWPMITPLIFIAVTASAATKPDKAQPSLTKVEVTNTVKTEDVGIPKPTEAACKVGDELRTSDLCAQWAAVDQTKRNTDLGWWTLWIGSAVNIFTLLGVALTFRETKKTADVVVKEFNNGAPLIQNLDIFGTIELREEGEFVFSLNLTYINYGARPALNLYVTVICSEFGNEKSEKVKGMTHGTVTHLNENEKFAWRYNVIRNVDVDKFLDEQEKIKIEVIVRYVDKADNEERQSASGFEVYDISMIDDYNPVYGITFVRKWHAPIFPAKSNRLQKILFWHKEKKHSYWQ